jgi:glycosyltransferase involved in cell wall biosynthesis
MPAVGIGIITYNRMELVAATIEAVRTLTRQVGAMLVVADDGSSDGTLAMLRDKQVPVVTGINMGIAWNKNRALFALSHLLGCDSVILLEDDTRPVEAGWESHWMEASRRWGHVNYAGEWMRHLFLSGSGTLDDPVRSLFLSAQCCGYSRDALTYAGYFDPRFRGYGHEHVEHSARLLRVGYGGGVEDVDGSPENVFKMIRGGVDVCVSKSHYNAEDEARNVKLAQQLMGQQGYRAPWGNDRELRQFRSEMESAMRGGAERFRIHGSQAGGVTAPSGRTGLFARLLNRA